LNEYEIYCQFLALQKHFTTKYDYFKYNGKIKASIKSYEARPNRGIFVYLARNEKNPIEYMVANFVAGKKWHSDFSGTIYQDWNRRRQSLSYLFVSELKELDEDFDTNFYKLKNEYPNIIRLYFAHKISFETLTIMLDIVGAFGYYTRILKDDVLWPPIGLRAEKYIPFLQKFASYERRKFGRLAVEQFGGMKNVGSENQRNDKAAYGSSETD
jgi:hypothetical protein